MENTKLAKEVFEFLNGENVMDKQHEAIMLLTVSEDGWPHTAMISVGEIVALSPEKVRIGLWKGTTTTANIIRTKKATLVLVYKGKAHYIRLSLEKLDQLSSARYPRERFAGLVVSAREDIAKYAEITSGIQIALKNPQEVLERWKETIEDVLK